VPLLLALTLREPVVHNPRVDRSGAERGATAVAYAIMLAILGLLLVAGIMVLSGSVETALNDGAECVSNPSGCGGDGGGGGDNGGGGGGGSTTITTGPAPTTTTSPGPTTTTTGS
jgi:Flp pilus assembly pilin Flp